MAVMASGGQVFDSGQLLEVVRPQGMDSLKLLHWDGVRMAITESIDVNGTEYKPLNLDLTILRALHLPSEAHAYDSPGTLVEKLTKEIEIYSGLPNLLARLVAFYVITTWFADCLPFAPRLSLIGPLSRGSDQLISLLHYFCRHAVRLTRATPYGILSMPRTFDLAIIIRQDYVSSELEEYLNAATMPGNFVSWRGEFRNPFAPVVLHTAKALSQSSLALEIEIPLLPAFEEPPLLSSEAEGKLAEQAQNQLLAYRLDNLKRVRSCTFDPAQLRFPTREVARTLGMCFPNNAELQNEIVGLLRPADNQLRVRRSSSAESVLLEVLLFRCHESQGDSNVGVYAGELATDMRILSRGRGHQIDLKPRAVGELLRSMGFEPDRIDRKGRGVRLCVDVTQHVHELAATFQVPSLMSGSNQCAQCALQRQRLHSFEHKVEASS
jgi:hypothetical protein